MRLAHLGGYSRGHYSSSQATLVATEQGTARGPRRREFKDLAAAAGSGNLARAVH